MTQGLYIGREVDPATHQLGDRLELDPADLVTHGLIVGMTGSGKTGLAIALLEEVLRKGIPILVLDPKGDLGNLLLAFDTLDAASFSPWVDREKAIREGKTVDVAAAEAAAAWQKGLTEWGLSAQDVRAFRESHDATIYTPGSSAGVPINVIQSLKAPARSFETMQEDLRDEIAGIVGGLLSLLHIDPDPIKSREFILLSHLVEAAWRRQEDVTLEDLIRLVGEPPFEKLGALPLESVYARKDRQALMMSLNNLLASPSFEAWRTGEPLDVGRLLGADKGRARLSIVYTAHLSDEERLFVTALFLEKVKTWMRQQGGTSGLRALVYMDEIYGYFPPHPLNPPTKRPLLTLLKQARAQGVGVLLATQNPVDLDYQGLANMGVWMVGKLQTGQDRERLREGLLGSGGMDARTLDRLLDATAKRVFLLHDVHRPKPCLLHSRWALSFLRGPLTRTEISRLMRGRTDSAAESPIQTPVAPGEIQQRATTTGARSGPPPLPSPLRSLYFARYGGEIADPHVFIKYAVRYKGSEEITGLFAYPLEVGAPSDVLEGEPLHLDEAALSTPAPADLRYADLPSWLSADGAKALEKVIKDRLADKLSVTLLHDPVTDEKSRPGESAQAFAARVQAAAGGPRADRLNAQLDKKRRELATREQELQGRKTEKWAALGTAILSNVGLLTGRKRTISGAGSVLSKNRMENTVEARIEALKAEIAALESDLSDMTRADVSRFVAQPLVPKRGDVKLLRYDVVWVF